MWPAAMQPQERQLLQRSGEPSRCDADDAWTAKGKICPPRAPASTELIS